jgi:hypothetical protein
MSDERDNVFSLEARRISKQVESGESGMFAEPDSIEEDLLHKLGPVDGDCAIGLMCPMGAPAENLPDFCGWYLTPATARELATLLRTYADDCEKGFPP